MLIAGAINKYCSILASPRFYSDIRLSYSKAEILKNVCDNEHRIFRAALQFTDINDSIELHSTSDVPAGCGFGTSSSFTVALLSVLHAYKRQFITQQQIAEEACHIEIDVLREPIGKQDQYMAAFGGLTCLTFEKNGDVLVEPLRVAPEVHDQLENNLILFFTGTERSASDILRDRDTKSKEDNSAVLRTCTRLRKSG